MPKRLSRDVNQAAFQMVQRSTSELKAEDGPEVIKPRSLTKWDISRVMSAMGRKGGKIGGKRSLVTLTPRERKERAAKAAKTRWAKHTNK
jgi:hypothetical protein